MKIGKKYFRPWFTAGLCLLLYPLSAQQQREMLVPLSGNPQIEAGIESVSARKPGRRQTEKSLSPTPLALPFFDDFAYAGPYPSSALWDGRQVYVNNSFPFFPPTRGVATFDGIDEYGRMYPHAVLGVSFHADTLCSLPIRLDSVFQPSSRALGPGDSVYLSFYYQPGGGLGTAWDQNRRGMAPAAADMLVLEFYHASDSSWEQVWETPGMDMKAFCPLWDSVGYPIQYQRYFRQVMVPVSDSGYFAPDFRFRFRNKSTIDADPMSAGGQWHIDYVYLNAGRSRQDTTVEDVAFIEATPSLLREYSEVPYRQFRPALLRDSLEIGLTNLSARMLSAHYRCLIDDPAGNTVYAQPQSGEIDIDIYPFISDGYRTDPVLGRIPFSYSFAEVASGPVSYTVRHVVKSGAQTDFSQRNDTVVFTQRFAHEFAYDDGTAESGWGLNYGNGAFACRFELAQADSLTAVRIFFNRSYGDQNQIPVNIVVWGAGSSDTMPGEVLYKEEDVRVEVEDGLNRFGTYRLRAPVLLPAGKFYVGLEQTDPVFLNIGFDQNSALRGRLLYSFYNTLEHRWEWLSSMYTGALMFRPVFGAAGISAGNESGEGISVPFCKVYPNPVRDGRFQVAIPETADPEQVRVSLYDMRGRCLWERKYTSVFNTGNQAPGVYIVRMTVSGKPAGLAKLVIVR